MSAMILFKVVRYVYVVPTTQTQQKKIYRIYILQLPLSYILCQVYALLCWYSTTVGTGLCSMRTII